jgi:tRNA(fMet)-specific endonuclease VapC
MTAVLHLLDTDTASFIIKGRSPAIEAKLAAIAPDRVCVSAITRAELMYGLKRLPASHRLHVAVCSFSRSCGCSHGRRTPPTTMPTFVIN